jgi:hypothetical protein
VQAVTVLCKLSMHSRMVPQKMRTHAAASGLERLEAGLWSPDCVMLKVLAANG